MSKPDVVAIILWAGVTLYAVFGGADFGAGVWELLARRTRLGDRARALIGHSVGPVWEANHVWLIFALVVLWTAFPDAFGAIMETLYIPLALAALGIVLRGSGFAFRALTAGAQHRWASEVFALSSVLTPFFMGTVVGAVASGRVPAEGGGDPLTSWTGPLSILVGTLFVATCAYLAAVFLVVDARRGGGTDLEGYFARRALIAGLAAGAIAVAGIAVLAADAEPVFDGLTAAGLPLVLVSGACGAVVLAMLARGGRTGIRPLAVGAVVAVIWGWGVAQHPYLLPEGLTVDAGAGAGASLTAVIVVFGVALVTVGPALVLLFWLAQRRMLE